MTTSSTPDPSTTPAASGTAAELAAARPTPDGYAGDLTPAEAWAALENEPQAALVDVRTRAEWAYVGAPDTSALGRPAVFTEWVRYPTGEANAGFLDELTEAGFAPGDGRPLLFLCRSGARSISAARAATAAGFGPAYNVLEGFEGTLTGERHRGGDGWRAAGLPWTQS